MFFVKWVTFVICQSCGAVRHRVTVHETVRLLRVEERRTELATVDEAMCNLTGGRVVAIASQHERRVSGECRTCLALTALTL